MVTSEDEMTVLPFSLHVMLAGGRLPEWMQKKIMEDPSFTVWLSGSERKVVRITAKICMVQI